MRKKQSRKWKPRPQSPKPKPRQRRKPLKLTSSVAKQAADKESPPPKSGAKVTIQQVGSAIGRQEYQRATLIGLGLNKLNRTRTLEDTPSVRGMIEKVKHLVKVVE